MFFTHIPQDSSLSIINQQILTYFRYWFVCVYLLYMVYLLILNIQIMEIQKKSIKNRHIFLLAKLLPSQGKHTNKVLPWLIQISQIVFIINCLIVSMHIPSIFITIDNSIVNQLIIYIRIGLAIAYLSTRFRGLFLICKLIGAVQLHTNPQLLTLIPISIEAVGFCFYYACKEQRKYNFDSRLYVSNGVFIAILFSLCQALTNSAGFKMRQVESINSNANLMSGNKVGDSSEANLFAIFLLSSLIVILIQNTFFYNSRTKNILGRIWLGITINSIIAILLKKIQFQDFWLILCGFIVIEVVAGYWGLFQHLGHKMDILYKDVYENFSLGDKINYLQALIYLIQNKDTFKVNGFIHYHYEKCKISRCPINYYVSQEKTPQTYKTCLFLFLRFLVEKSYTQSSVIRDIHIFYKQTYDDHFINFMRSTDFNHIRQKHRVIMQNKKNEDLDIQILHIKQAEQTLINITKEYLQKYHQILCYLSGDSIQLTACEKKSKKIIVLRQQILGFLNNESRLSEHSLRLLKMMLQKVINFKFDINPEKSFPKHVILRDFQTPMVIVSAQQQNIGKIIDSNAAGRLLLGYGEQDVKSLHINQLLPESFRENHLKILQKAAKRIQYDNKQIKKTPTLVFVKTRSGYSSICKLHPHAMNGIHGKRWVCQLQQFNSNKASIVTDQNGIIIGISRCAINLGFQLDSIGSQIKNTVFQKIRIQQAPTFGPQQQTVQYHRFNQSLRWQLSCEAQLSVLSSSKKIQSLKLPKFIVFLVTPTTQKKIVNFNPFVSTNTQIPSNRTLQLQGAKITQQILNSKLQINFGSKQARVNKQIVDFQFSFNHQKLTYIDQKIPQPKKFPGFTSDDYLWSMIKQIKRGLHYGDDINQMIYINGKLQFRENNVYSTDYQWESLPNHKQQEKRTVLKQIQLSSFSETMNSIIASNPRQLTVFSVLFAIAGLLIIGCFLTVCISEIIIVQHQFNGYEFQNILRQQQRIYINMGNQVIERIFAHNGYWNQQHQTRNFSQIFEALNRNQKLLLNYFAEYHKFYNQQLDFTINGFRYMRQITKDIEIRVTTGSLTNSQNSLNVVNLVIKGVYPAINFFIAKGRQQFQNKDVQIHISAYSIIGACAFLNIIAQVALYLNKKKIMQQKERLLRICSTFNNSDIEMTRIKVEFLKNHLDMFLDGQDEDDEYLSRQQERIDQQRNKINQLKKQVKLIPSSEAKKFNLTIVFNIIGILLSLFYFFLGKQVMQIANEYRNYHPIFNPSMQKLILIDLAGKQAYLQSQITSKPIDSSIVLGKIQQFYTIFNEASKMLYSAKQKIDKGSQFNQFIETIYSNRMCEALQIGSRCSTDMSGALSKSMNQLAMQQSILQQRLFVNNQFNLSLSQNISSISQLYISKLVKIGTQKSDKQYNHQLQQVQVYLVVLGAIFVLIFLVGTILGVLWIRNRKGFIQEPLNLLVNLIPMSILVNNFHFKKWYFQKFSSQVY